MQKKLKTTLNPFYAKSKSGVKPSVGPLIDDNGMLVSDDQDMSDLLNTFFASVFTTEDYYNLPAAKKYSKVKTVRNCAVSLLLQKWSKIN